MSLLDSVLEKIRIELMIKRASRETVEIGRGVVRVDLIGAFDVGHPKNAKLSGNIKRLEDVLFASTRTLDREDVRDRLCELVGLALRSCRYRAAAAMVDKLHRFVVATDHADTSSLDARIFVSRPYVEGDKVIMTDLLMAARQRQQNETKTTAIVPSHAHAKSAEEERRKRDKVIATGTIVMPTSSHHYAVRLDIDDAVRRKVQTSKIQPADGTIKKTTITMTIRDIFGVSSRTCEQFCEGFVWMGPRCHWNLFPPGIGSDADVSCDLSGFPGIFCGREGRRVESCLYALSVLLDIRASQRVRLDLAGNWIGSRGFCALSPSLHNLTRLRELNVERNGISVDGAKALVAALRHFPHLRVLNVRRNALGPEGVRRIMGAFDPDGGAAHLNRTLRVLDISVNFAGDVGIRHVTRALHAMRGLKTLRMSGNQMRANAACDVFRALASSALLRTLHELDVSDNPIEMDGAEMLANEIARLSSGDGDENETSSSSISIEMHTLRMRCCDMTGEGGTALSRALVKMPMLSVLDVSKNRIDREGAERIFDATSNLSRLTRVHIGSNPIGVKMQREFCMRFNPKRTRLGGTALVRTTPPCEIVVRNNRA